MDLFNSCYGISPLLPVINTTWTAANLPFVISLVGSIWYLIFEKKKKKKKKKGKTHADVAANISTLRALVTIAKQQEKIPVNRTERPSLTRLLWTKYKITIDVIGIIDARTVPKILTALDKFDSEYSHIADSGSSGTGFLNRCPILLWKQGMR